MKRLLFSATAFAIYASAALAQTAVAVDPTAIPLKPWIDFVQPYLTAIATTVAPVIAGWLALKIASWLHVSMTGTQVERLKSEAATEAGALVAASTNGLANEVIHASDPRVVAAANSIAKKLPDTMAAVGATPDALAKMVQGEVGKLQSTQQATAPPIVAVPMKG